MSNSTTSTPSTRKDRYLKILDRFCIDPEDDSYSGGEDAGEWLNGVRPMGRYCVVTFSGEFVYTYAHDDTMDAAKERAFSNIDDDCFAESPVCIIDLDTGEEWKPDYSTIQWNKQ